MLGYGWGRVVIREKEDSVCPERSRARSAASAPRNMASNEEAWSSEVMVDWSLLLGTGNVMLWKSAVWFIKEEREG